MTQSQINVDVLNGYNKEQVKVVAAVLIDPATGLPVAPGSGGGGGSTIDFELLLIEDVNGVVGIRREVNNAGAVSVQYETLDGSVWVPVAPVKLVKPALPDNAAAASKQDLTNAALGAPADAVAGNDTGTFSLLALTKRLLGKLPALGPQSGSNSISVTLAADTVSKVSTANINTKFREAFQTFVPGERWDTVTGTGDIIMLDGNAAAASYLVISKNPLVAGTVSSLTSIPLLQMPMEIAIGLHMSQRALGQEFVFELVSTETPLPTYTDAAIASISQTTTVLTVNTTLPHGLVPGQRIGIYGVNDSRMNYASLVVASIPSPTQITATAGPGGTIPSLTAGPFTSGFIYVRSALDYAPNGTSMVLENTSTTNASFYVRAEAGDALPSGTLMAAHTATIASTASIVAANTAYAYSFQPTSEYRLNAFIDGVQWSSVAVDSIVASTSAYKRTQVVPNPTKDYKLRVRGTNNKGLTIPNAQIVSVAKSGATTATITTDVPHGLTVADVIITYGVRDQVNFANLLAATAVASIISPTQFTVVWGSAVTATSYGGFVARVQGGNLGTTLGYNVIAASSVSVAGGIVTLVGSGTWAGLSIGDLINLVGVRNAVGGATLNLEGAYRVRNLVTSTLELEAVGATPVPGTLASVSCGGAVIKRTDLRLSFVRALDFERQRVEMMPRPQGDLSASASVNVQNTPSVTVSSGTVTTLTTLTSMTSGNLGLPGTVQDIVSAAITSTATLAAVTPTFGISYEINIPVTAVTGTNPTMDVDVQESDDSGTNWFTVYSFPRITATGMYRSPKLPLTGNRIRYVQTIGGTTPSFTRALNRMQCSDTALFFRQSIDRSVSLTTLNAATPSLNIQQCRNAQLVINLGAATTPPALQLEGSDDNGVSWYAVGAPLTGVASSSVQLTVNNVNSGLLRARVSTIGVTVTMGHVLLKGF